MRLSFSHTRYRYVVDVMCDAEYQRRLKEIDEPKVKLIRMLVGYAT